LTRLLAVEFLPNSHLHSQLSLGPEAGYLELTPFVTHCDAL
jgi:hypothetical protein